MGLVLDDEQMPVPGADVWLKEDAERRAIADTQGRYTILAVNPGTYTLVAAKAGYVSGEKRIDVGADDIVSADFSLTPIPTEVARVASYIAEAIIEFEANAFGLRHYDNSSGTQYRDIFYALGPAASTAVVGVDWIATSPVSAKWMFLGLFVGDPQCVHWCKLVNQKEGRSPLTVRTENLEALGEGHSNLTVNPYLAIQPPCVLGAPDKCSENPDAVVQVARDQRFRVFTHVFYVDPAPKDFDPFPRG